MTTFNITLKNLKAKNLLPRDFFAKDVEAAKAEIKKVSKEQVGLVLSCLKNNKVIAKSTLFKALEKRLPFEVKEENFQKVATQFLTVAKRVSEEIKKNPVNAIKNIKQLLKTPSTTKTSGSAKKTRVKKEVASTKTPRVKKTKSVH